jgi:hypothetical protein
LKTKKIGENEPGAKLVIHEIPPENLVDDEEYFINLMTFSSLISFYFLLLTLTLHFLPLTYLKENAYGIH